MVTFVVISVLNLATPSTSSNLDTSSYTFATIVLAKNETIEYMWCLKNKDASDTAVKSFCSNYISKQLVNVFIGVLISLVIVIVKNILKAIVIKLAHFQRYKSYTEQSGDIMKNLFYTYVSTTVLITLLVPSLLFSYKPTYSIVPLRMWLWALFLALIFKRTLGSWPPMMTSNLIGSLK